MKNAFSPIAVLILSLLSVPRAFCADVNRTDADHSAPAVQTYLTTPEDSEVLSEVLQVQPQIPRGPQDILADYETGMANITKRISGELGEISEAVGKGELSSAQGEYLARERYQVAMMQFQLLSASHAILEQAVAQASTASLPAEGSSSEQTLIVPLPFSSLQLSPALVQYLELTPKQTSGIQQVMASERVSFAPLMAELDSTRQKLEMAKQTDHPDEKEIRSLALAQARLLTKAVAEDADLQSKISRLLNSEQRRKINRLNQANELRGLQVATVTH
jgi:Spy/CpxP family protein refolding chaperone